MQSQRHFGPIFEYKWVLDPDRSKLVNGTVQLTVGEPPEEATGIKVRLSMPKQALAYFHNAY